MQRLIKGFAVGILCLPWSIPALAQNLPDELPATCTAVTSSVPPASLTVNTPSLLATSSGPHFLLECRCLVPKRPAIQDNFNNPLNPNGSTVKLSIIGSTPNNVSASIIASEGTNQSSTEIEIPYSLQDGETSSSSSSKSFGYTAQVSSLDNLQAGQYSVTVQFELIAQPVCASAG
jgi:hypothetical protein